MRPSARFFGTPEGVPFLLTVYEFPFFLPVHAPLPLDGQEYQARNDRD
jgi:hypothetical protein